MKANKRDRIVKVRLTNLEYEELTKASKSSKCMSDYFRQRVFRKGVGLIDPKEFIRSIINDIQSHIKSHELSDDLSMLTFIYGSEWNIKKS